MSRMRSVPVVANPPACMRMRWFARQKGVSRQSSVGGPRTEPRFPDLGSHPSTYLFGEECHWESLVQHSQLSRLGLLVVRVSKDTTVKEGSVDISNHGTDVSSRVGLGTLALRELDAVQILEDRLVVIHAVAFVDRVDLATARQSDVGVGKDEFADLVVQSIAVDAVTCCQDQVGRRTVHAVSRGHHLASWTQDVLQSALRAVLDEVDTEDSTDVDTGINVARAVQWIKHNAVFAFGRLECGSFLLLADEDSFIVLLRNQNCGLARSSQRVDHDLVGKDIKLLLVLALDICVSRGANTVNGYDGTRSAAATRACRAFPRRSLGPA